jgi:hypothetical protein
MARTKQTARKAPSKKGAEAQEEEQEEAYYSDAEPDIGRGLFDNDDDYEEEEEIKGKRVPQKGANQLKKLEQFQQQQTKSKSGPVRGKGGVSLLQKMGDVERTTKIATRSEMVIDWKENLSNNELIIADLDQVFKSFVRFLFCFWDNKLIFFILVL